MSRKAQVEIMGLVIIVVLILLGVLFAVQFVLKRPGSTLAQEVEESQLASNMLNTLLGITTSCHDATVAQLLQDCAVTSRLRCPQSSCVYAQSVIKQIFDETLNAWNREYYFSVSGSATVNSIGLGEACKGEYESKSRPLPTAGGGTITLKLDLCS
jgi:PDZ domain-containing secreted protein